MARERGRERERPQMSADIGQLVLCATIQTRGIGNYSCHIKKYTEKPNTQTALSEQNDLIPNHVWVDRGGGGEEMKVKVIVGKHVAAAIVFNSSSDSTQGDAGTTDIFLNSS